MSVVPQPYELYLSRPRLLDLDGLPILKLCEPSASSVFLKAKRGVDIAVGGVLFAFSLFIIVPSALVLRIFKGRGFQWDTRCGLNFEQFKMLRLNVERNAFYESRFERLLDRFSVTELPQLWNVLKGEMSLVGPRPEPPARTRRYTTWEQRRLSVQPGMTGLAQVRGLREEHSSEAKSRLTCSIPESLPADRFLNLATDHLTLATRKTSTREIPDTRVPWGDQDDPQLQSLILMRRSTHVLIVRSPVRISFAGGGTDLPTFYEQFGGSVVSAAINKYFYTILGKRSDGRIQVISSDLRIFENWRDIATMDVRGSGLEIPLAVMKDLGRDMSVDLFLASEIPPGTGLGSSASVCVNILKTLASYLQIPLSKYDLAERAFQIARHGLNRHVGKQDEYAAAYGGLNRITFHRDGGTEVAPLEPDSRVRTPVRKQPHAVLHRIRSSFLDDSRGAGTVDAKLRELFGKGIEADPELCERDAGGTEQTGDLTRLWCFVRRSLAGKEASIVEDLNLAHRSPLPCCSGSWRPRRQDHRRWWRGISSTLLRPVVPE